MDQRSTELALLSNPRARRAELTALLEQCSSHWRFEDPIYSLLPSKLQDPMLSSDPRPLTPAERALMRQWLGSWSEARPVLEDERWQRVRALTDDDAWEEMQGLLEMWSRT